MKNNSLFMLPIASFAIACFISSCTKSSTSSAATKLVGTWKDVEAYVDYNNNGIRDASELQYIPASQSSIITFKANGTGIDIEPAGAGGIDTFSFSYKVKINQLILYMDNDSAMTTIDSISSSRLIFKYTSSGSPTSWDIFEKQ